MTFRNHRFSRLELLVGREGLTRFRNKHVLVVGLGGVGSYAAEALARAAVGKLTLVDHDEVCATNVNRQIHAFSDTVGQKKVLLMAERIKRINPLCEALPLVTHHHPDKGAFIFEEAERLAGQPVDAVLDCIDTLVPKVDLLRQCVERGVPVITSMGSASRLDPSKIRLGDVSETKNDPFAKTLRAKLREVGIHKGIKAVYSLEKPIDPEQVVPGTEWQCICPNIAKEFGACVHKRFMIGTISYMPPIFGMTMASELLRTWLEGVDFANREAMEAIPTFMDLQKAMKLGQTGPEIT